MTEQPELPYAAQSCALRADVNRASADSTSNQEDTIREYASRRGFEIVRTFADEGKSGLNVAGERTLPYFEEQPHDRTT